MSYWIVAHHFAPFDYAARVSSGDAAEQPSCRLSRFLIGVMGYIAVPDRSCRACGAARGGRARRHAVARGAGAAHHCRRFRGAAHPGRAGCGAAAGSRSSRCGRCAAMTLVPVVLLSSPLMTVSRTAAVRVLALAIVFPLLMTLVSPAIAIVIHRRGVPNYATHYRQLAQAIDRAWREHSDQPLRYRRQLHQYRQRRVVLSAGTSRRRSTSSSPRNDTLGRRGQGQARRHRAGLSGAGDGMHADAQRAHRKGGVAAVVGVSIARTYLGFTDAAGALRDRRHSAAEVIYLSPRAGRGKRSIPIMIRLERPLGRSRRCIRPGRAAASVSFTPILSRCSRATFSSSCFGSV